MSVISQNDGTQFVIQAYRERVEYKKKSQAETRIRNIAEQQGHFVRLFKHQAGELEAVFSTEPGYLLGESIKQYFQETKNLVYCEKIKGSKQNVLVIIKNGHVFTDTIIEDHQLKAELLPLLTLKTSFQIVASKDAPLIEDSSQQTEERYCFPLEHTTSFEYLSSPLLPRLPSIPKVRLLPLQIALKSQGLRKNSFLNLSLTLGFLFAAIIGLMIVSAYKKTNTPVHPHKPHSINPFAAFDAALNSPEPSSQLSLIVVLVNKLYQMPGWELAEFSQKNDVLFVQVKSIGGSISALQTFADNNQFELSLHPSGVTLKAKLLTSPRSKQPHIYSLTHMSEALLDTLAHSLIGIRVSLLKTTQHGRAISNLFQLDFSDASPKELLLLQNILHNLPAVLVSADFRTNSAGLFSGRIKLSLWGK